MRYCYSCRLGFIYIFQLYIWFSTQWCRYRYHASDIVHWSAAPYPGLTNCFVCSFIYFLDDVLFNHHGCDYYCDFYVHYFSFRPTCLGFLKLCCFGSAIISLNVSAPGFLSLNIESDMLLSDSFVSCSDYLHDIMQGSSRFCNWISLRWLVPWIHYLPPVCRSTFFRNLFWNDSGFVNIRLLRTIFCCFQSCLCIYIYIYIYVSQYDNI